MPPTPLQLEHFSDGSFAGAASQSPVADMGLHHAHPLPCLHFLWREVKGLLASGGLANPPSRQTGRRQLLGQLPFSPLPSGVHLSLGVPDLGIHSSQPRDNVVGGCLAHSCALSWGATEAREACIFSPDSSTKSVVGQAWGRPQSERMEESECEADVGKQGDAGAGSGPCGQIVGVPTEAKEKPLTPGTSGHSCVPCLRLLSESIETRGCK